MALTPSQRDQVTIQTKAGIVKDGPYFDYSYEHLTSSVEGSDRKSDAEIRALVGAARDAGIDFLDHADIYGEHLHQCEERFAQAMALTPSQRDQVTIQTKAGIVKDGPYFDYSYEHLTSSVEG